MHLSPNSYCAFDLKDFHNLVSRENAYSLASARENKLRKCRSVDIFTVRHRHHFHSHLRNKTCHSEAAAFSRRLRNPLQSSTVTKPTFSANVDASTFSSSDIATIFIATTRNKTCHSEAAAFFRRLRNPLQSSTATKPTSSANVDASTFSSIRQSPQHVSEHRTPPR